MWCISLEYMWVLTKISVVCISRIKCCSPELPRGCPSGTCRLSRHCLVIYGEQRNILLQPSPVQWTSWEFVNNTMYELKIYNIIFPLLFVKPYSHMLCLLASTTHSVSIMCTQYNLSAIQCIHTTICQTQCVHNTICQGHNVQRAQSIRDNVYAT